MTNSVPRGLPEARGLVPLVAAACLLAACARAAVGADAPEKPVKKPAVRVVVDPRVELMSTIFRLAGNPEYGRGRVPSYTADVEKQFGPFRDHEVVKLAKRLRRTRGVSYDAVMSMAFHVTDAASLAPRAPLDPRPASLDARWRPDEAKEFLTAARRFVKDASFADFLKKHQELYRLTEKRMQEVLDKEAHLEWFDAFFGQRPQASFTVALGMLNGGGCYGAHFRGADGREDLYCVLGVWSTDVEGKPRFDRSMLGTVVHEFCHSYTNALVDRHAAELEKAGRRIFPLVADRMRRQAYANWKTMMYESLVRACVLRYTRRYEGAVAAWMATQQQKGRGFLWIGDLADLLSEYESHRDKYPTLESFAPRIVAFFDKHAEGFAARQKELDAKRPKVVSIAPANGATDVDPGTKEIRVVFDRPMRDGAWSMVGGGPNFPEIAGKPSYDKEGKVWTVPVKLKPGWSYRFMLNSDRYTAFQSRDGEPLEPVVVTFATKK